MRRFVLLLGLVCVGLAAAVWLLRIDEIKVEGTNTLSARAIIEASGLEPGERILWERLSVAERDIEAIPGVADAVAQRQLPSTVVLSVIEREPIARLDTVDVLAVDSEGVMFATGDADVRAKIYGWKGRPRPGGRIDERSRTVLDAFSRFPPTISLYARRLRIADDGFTLTLSGGTQIRFGVLRDLEAKAEVALAILRTERERPLAYVDVRSPAVPVSRERADPTPGATPAPFPATPAPPATGEPSLTP